MSLLSRLFRRGRSSRLRTFLEGITPPAIQSAAMRVQGEEMRIGTVVSLTVLAAARDLGRDVPEAIRALGKPMGAPTPHPAVFDIVVFETAAFAHYTLMAPYLRPIDEEELDEETDDDDPYFETIRTAAHLSGRIVTDHTDFGLPSDFFMNRIASYNFDQTRSGSNMIGGFQAILTTAIDGGTPRAGRSAKISLDLPLTLGLTATVIPFCTAMLPALLTVARNAYDHAEELGLLE